MATEDYFASLADPDRNPPAKDVARLSGLEIEAVRAMDSDWAALPAERRLAVLSRMTEMADSDVELDFQSFFQHAMDDADGPVRECAILGLWECEDRRAVPSLVRLLRDDDEDAVRVAAALVLGHYALLVETGKLSGRDRNRIYGSLLAALDDPHELLEVRRRALESISVFKSPEVEEWIRWAYDDGEPALRQSSIFAMGRSCDPVWLPTIIDELGSDDAATRYEAADASSEHAAEEAVPHLVQLLGDDDVQVQMAVIHALGVIGGTEARTALRRVAGSDEEGVKEAAEEALALADLDQAGPSMRLRPGM